jgi:hypothetical protein
VRLLLHIAGRVFVHHILPSLYEEGMEIEE